MPTLKQLIGEAAQFAEIDAKREERESGHAETRAANTATKKTAGKKATAKKAAAKKK